MNLTGVATRPALEPGQARNEIQPPTLTTLPDAVAKNMAIVRSRTRAQVMAVVKADGYGHGDLTLARAAVDAGATWLGTTDLAAAARLRAAGLEVPILSWLNPSGIDAELALDQRIDIAIGSVDELGALCPDPPIHRYYAAPDRRAGGVDNA
ncbi:MAG: alanine racemase, partial [Propionibacteriaceae bacterium]|nr:alanine racemase [Propionibacteriaceae bacterium]